MPQGSAIGTVAARLLAASSVTKSANDDQPAMRRLQVGVSRSLIAGLRAPTHPSLFGDVNMLQTIAIILIILWVLGLVSSYTMGGFIHILLVVAVVIILLRLIQGRGL
jgi:hypothetical protein